MPTATYTLEGPDLEALLARVPGEFGADATIVAANRLRSGGIGGFFSKETYEVVVEAPAVDPAPVGAQVAPVASAPAGVRDEGFSAVLGRLVRDAGALDSSPQPDGEGVDDGLPFGRLPTGEDLPFEPLVPAVIGRTSAATPVPVTVPVDPAPARPARAAEPRRLPTVSAPPAPALDRGWLRDVGVPAEVTEGAIELAGDPTVELLHLMERLPQAEPLPRHGGSVIAVVGPRQMALGIAEHFAVQLGADPHDVLIATNRARARIHTDRHLDCVDTALERRRAWRRRKRPTVIAVEADLGRRPTGWASNLLDAVEPTMVWGVVEATRKPEDVRDWAIRMGGLDALAVTGLEDTTSPAAVLGAGVPVGLVDGEDATPLRWTAILAGRLLEAA